MAIRAHDPSRGAADLKTGMKRHIPEVGNSEFGFTTNTFPKSAGINSGEGDDLTLNDRMVWFAELKPKVQLNAYHPKVFDGMSNRIFSADFERTLVVTIWHVVYHITEEVMNQLFDPFGLVEMIEILPNNETFQALVRYQFLESSHSAKSHLHARCIYDCCCMMNIEHLSKDFGDEVVEETPVESMILQVMEELKKEISVGFQKMRDTLSKPKILMKYTAPTNLSEKLADDESVLLKEESDEIWVKEGEIDPEIQVFDDMPVSGPDMFDDMLVSGVEESEKVEINSNLFDEIPMKNIEQLKSINVGSKVFVAKDLIEMKKVDAVETGPKVLDEMIRIDESEDSQTNIMESLDGCYLIKDKLCLLSDDGIGFGGFLIEPGGFVETDIGVEHKKWGESGFTILIPWQNTMSFYTCKKLNVRGNLMCLVIWLIAPTLKTTLWESCLQWVVIAESFTKGAHCHNAPWFSMIPPWKGSGYTSNTTMFMQAQMLYMLSTGLEDYKARGTQVSPFFIASYYKDFADNKDLVRH